MKKRLCSLALSLALCLGLLTPAFAAESDLFPATAAMPSLIDIHESGEGDVWYDYASVKVCVEAGLMKGSGMCFSPGDGITLAELAIICARINEKLGGQPIPEHQEGTPWYAPEVSIMDELGIETGPDPLVPATRSDFARMLSAVCTGDSLKAINTITALPDTDDRDALRLYNAGILTGTDNYGTFSGQKGLSRAETAAMLARVARPSLRKRFTLAAKSTDPVLNVLGVSAGTTILTSNGNAVTAQEYLFWLVSAMMALDQYSALDWTSEQDGQSMSEFLKENARDTAVLYSVVNAEAAKAGIGLTQEDLAAIDQDLASSRVELGEEAYQLELRKLCLTEEAFRSLLKSSYLHTRLKDHLFSTPDQKELDAYIAEEGILRAKHILIKDQAQAESVLAQLKAGGNTETMFDTLAEQYSVDGRGSDGKLAAPGGYTFGPGDMVQTFEDGAKALNIGEVSGLVQSSYGYHIILRLPVRADDVLLQGSRVRDAWADARMNALMSGKIRSAILKTTPLYDSLDPQAIWTAVSAY